MKPTRLVPWLVLLLLLMPSHSATAADKATLDDGLLVRDWFPGAGEFRETDSFDYIWVKEGFTFAGHSVGVKPWEEPAWLDKERDAKDRAKGEELTVLMPARLKGALGAALEGKSAVSKDEGDLVLEGRFADVNAGSKAAKFWVGFGAGSATATWDMKFVDTATGEVVVAIHHRAVSGTSLSEIDDKIASWLDDFAGATVSDFREYAAGKKRKK